MREPSHTTGPRFTRRTYLNAGTVGLLGLAGLGGSASGARPDVMAQFAAQLAQQEDPEIPEKGYLVEELADGLYWITEGIYQMMFLTTGEGVVVVDAPPTIGANILNAIGEVTDEPITHVVYTHYHADHIGGASLYPDDAEYIAHVETASLLDRFGDPSRPVPTTVFGPRAASPPGRDVAGANGFPSSGRKRRHVVGNSYTLKVGDQRLELDYRGPNHSVDNIYVYAPDQKVLMFVDVVFPGWIPFQNLAESSDIPGYVEAHDRILEYDFDTLVAGHLTRLGTRADVETQRAFIQDLEASAREAIATVTLNDVFQEFQPTNLWEIFDGYLELTARTAAEPLFEPWEDELRGFDVFVEGHAATMVEALRIDFGVLGPFGLPEP